MQGLQVFDGGGNLVFDTTTSLTVVLGEVSIAPKATINITNDGLLNGKPFIVTSAMCRNTWIDYSVSGNQLTLTYRVSSWNNSVTTNETVLYGVY